MRASVEHSPEDIRSSVRTFYDRFGWHSVDGRPHDQLLWEDERNVARAYQQRCRRRLARLFRGRTGVLLDAGCGPVQHREYGDLYAQFTATLLLDISEFGLRRILPRPGWQRVVASVDELPVGPALLDAALSVNVINHVPADLQERAVRELLGTLKPGGRLVCVSYNPQRAAWPGRTGSARPGRGPRDTPAPPAAAGGRHRGDRSDLYWHAPTIGWWSRFRDEAHVREYPYRLLFVTDLRRLVPDHLGGRLLLALVSVLEDLLPRWAARRGAYYAIVLDRRKCRH